MIAAGVAGLIAMVIGGAATLGYHGAQWLVGASTVQVAKPVVVPNTQSETRIVQSNALEREEDEKFRKMMLERKKKLAAGQLYLLEGDALAASAEVMPAMPVRPEELPQTSGVALQSNVVGRSATNRNIAPTMPNRNPSR